MIFVIYLWHSVAVEAHHDAAEVLISMLDVEEDLVGDPWALGSLYGLGKVYKGEGEDHQESSEESLEVAHLCD